MSELQAVEPKTPDVLMTQCVESGNAEMAKLLVDTHKWWLVQERLRLFNEAMTRCQKAMPVVVKDAINEQTRSGYAPLETIEVKCKPIWLEHGFNLTFGEESSEKGSDWKRITVDVRHDGGHVHRVWTDLPLDGIGPRGNPIGGMNRIQGAASPKSYGKRYLICDVFDITIADSDRDGQGIETISKEDIATLDQWIQSTNTDSAKFFKWAGVEKLADFPKYKLDQAVRFFREKQERG